MEKLFLSLRRKISLSCIIMLMLVLSVGCKKDSVDEHMDPVSHLMSFNLAPDKAAVNISVSGDVITNQPLGYPNYTGLYQDVDPGLQTVQSVDVGLNAAMASASLSFEEDKYYSLFVLGNQGNYSNIIVRDNYESLPVGSGKSYVRYINAIPDSSDLTVSITANGSVILATDVHYATVSDFFPLDGLDLVIGIDNGVNVTAQETFNFQIGKAYTVLFTGIPGTPDLSKAVKIQYALTGSAAGN